MAENVPEKEIQTLNHLPTPSELLNLLVRGIPLNIGGNIVRYEKNEYSVIDSGGNIVFRRIPNAMSFWELTQFLGIEG